MKGMSRLILKNSMLALIASKMSQNQRYALLVLERTPLPGVGFSPGFHTCPIEIRSSFRRPPYTRLTNPRDTITALYMDVRIPRQRTTANPLIGPDPNANSAMPAIRVVMFE